VTVALDEATDTAADEWQTEGRPAGWWARAAAFGIDVLVPLAAVATLLLIGWSAPRGGWLWWVCLVLAAALVVAVAVNRLLLPDFTGWSLGRSVVGIAVVERDGDGGPGPWRLLLRDLAHVCDTVPMGLGWLWPLLDARGRTFADMLARTEVLEIDGTIPDRRRMAAMAIGAAAALSVLPAGLGYAAVYRHQQSVATARTQIADEGPVPRLEDVEGLQGVGQQRRSREREERQALVGSRKRSGETRHELGSGQTRRARGRFEEGR
jgi:Mce-associated membrane protein